MEDWANAVESGGSLAEVYPVNVQPTAENALTLRNRLSFLKENVLPSFG
jgi:hypothetical protein